MGAAENGGRENGAKSPRPEATSPLETVARLNATLDALPDLLFVLDREGRIVDYHAPNPERLYVPPDQFLGRTMDDVLPEPARGIVIRAIADARARGHHQGSVYSLSTPSGERWFEISIASQGDPHAAGGRLVAIVRDVTERQRAEDALRESEQTYRMLTEGMQDVIWILDVEARRFTYVSPSVEKLRGYTPAEVLARPLEDAWVPEQREELEQFVRRSVAAFLAGQITAETCVTYEMLQPCKDGSRVASEVVARLVRNERTGRLEAHGVTRNITKRVQAEAALRASEARFAQLARQSRTIVFEMDAEGRCTFVSPEVEAVLGYRPEDVVGKLYFYDLFSPSDREAFKTAAFDVFRNKTPLIDFENPCVTRDGRHVWVSTNAFPMLDPAGTLRGYRGNVRDVTDRKRAEKILRESEARFAETARQTRTFVWEVDADGLYMFVTPVVEDVLGYRPDEIAGRLHFYDLHPAEGREEYRAAVLAAARQGREFRNLENPMVAKDGRIVWVSTNALPLRGADGSLRGYRGSDMDITARKLAEEALRESETRFAASTKASRSYVWQVDPEGLLTYVSPMVEEVLGRRPEEMVGQLHFYDLLPQEDREEIKRFGLALMARRETISGFENRNVARDGRRVWLSSSASPLFGPDGTFRGYQGIDTDITDRKRAEEELKRSEAKYRQLHESMRDPFASTDLKGNLLDFNPAFVDLLGYSRAELLGRNFRAITPRKWQAQEKKIIAEQVRKRGFSSVYEKEYVRKDGSVVPVELRTMLVCDAGGKPTGMSAVIRDVSERRQAEQALRESEAKYRRLLAGMQEAFVIADMEGRLVECNPAFESLIGYSHAEVARLHYADITPAKWRSVDARAVKRVRRHGSSGVTEKEYIRKDGTLVPVEMTGTLIRDTSGKPVGISAIIHDVTERKRAEQALQAAHDKLEQRVRERTAELADSQQALAASEEQFRQMAENVQDAFWLIDAKTANVLYVSPAFQRIWNRPPVKDVSRWIADIHPEDRERVARAFRNGMKTGVPAAITYRLIWPDGSIRWIESSGAMIRDARGRPLRAAGLIRDVTEQRRLESEILQAAEAERQRIGRDLHDSLGQSLTAIGYLADAVREDLARAKRPEAADVRKLGRRIEKAAEQSHALARGLLLADVKRGGLAAALQELAFRTQELFGVACRYSGLASVPPLDANVAGQLYRIAQEAVANAAKHGQAPRIDVRLALTNQDLLLSVRDTGKGIPLKKKTNAGLGLNIMRYRAGMIGATLEIDSARNRGTIVNCRLPLAAPAPKRKS